MTKRFLENLGKLVLAFSALFFFAPMANAQNDLVTLNKPTEQKISGYERIFCVKLDESSRVCKGLPDAENSTGEARFFVERGGRQTSAWNAAAFLGDVSQFEIWRGDLDNDAQDEIVILNSEGQSNGMGITYQTVFILPSSFDTVAAPIEPLRFSAEDFSVKGGFVKNKQTKRFEIFVSNWEWNWQPRGKKEGLYLVVRRFAYQNGALDASSQFLTVRRYTKKFERERLATLEKAETPLAWLDRSVAETRNADLMNVGDAKTIFEGTIETATRAPFDPANSENESPILTLNVKTIDGKNRTLEYRGEDVASPNQSFALFGTQTPRRVFPKNYLPAGASEKLPGRKIRLVQYNDKSGGGFAVLWLFGGE